MTSLNSVAGSASFFDHNSLAARAMAGSIFGQQAISSLSNASPVAQLVDQIRQASSPVELGQMLRALDGVSGGRTESNTLVNGDAPTGAAKAGAAASAPKPKYDASSLYAKGGPSANDIEQNNFGDCYYVGTLGAVANQNPQTIRNAISYDAKTQSFNVTLYGADGKAHKINVTQADVDGNIARGGGSHRDNGVASAPIWPDVMEAAYAKQLDTNWKDGFEQGYTTLAGGGSATEAMRVISGTKSDMVRFDQGFFESRGSAMDKLGTRIETALSSGKAVTLDSRAEDDNRGIIGQLMGDKITRDGLVNSHTYTVTGAFKDAKGEWQVTVRNPWANNATVGEGYNTNSATITIPLSRMVDTGGLASFGVGH